MNHNIEGESLLNELEAEIKEGEGSLFLIFLR